jgi:arylsulfatase A-like enzyme
MSSRPNILLISIDTLRADHLSCYGYPRLTSPALDALAADGTRYRHAYTNAGWTPPAHASMLTGLFPSQHGVVDTRRLPDTIPTLAALLAGDGYRTAGIVNNSQVGALVGLDRGHETFHEVWKGHPSRNLVGRGVRYLRRQLREWLGVNDHGAERTNQLAKQWLAARAAGGTPFYLFLHYIEPHNPLNAPHPFKHRFLNGASSAVDWRTVRRAADNPLICLSDGLSPNEDEIAVLKALYDGEIAYIDQKIGELLEWLRGEGLYDDTLIMVTADHGEHFGEHGLYSHVWSLYEPVLHIPLIVKFPSGYTQPALCDELVQLIDIVPTAAQLAGLRAPAVEALPGRSLASRDGERVGHEQIIAEWEGRIPYFIQKRLKDRQATADCRRFLEPFCAIRVRQHKYLLRASGAEELYDLTRDPVERHNLAAAQPAVTRALKARLLEWKTATSAGAVRAADYAMDQETRRHLESLGYL